MCAEPFDVVVIGGGFAGLSGALTLARARRKVAVIDDGKPRNMPAGESHGYLSRDGTPPLAILDVGRQELRNYGVHIIPSGATSLARLSDGRFRVTGRDGCEVVARRLLVTTGLVDQLPDIPRLRERWGRDVVHCPFCFGWEMRDMSFGLLATGPQPVGQALMWRQWSPDLILFQHTQPAPPAEQARQLAARGIRLVKGEVVTIEVTADRLTGVRLRSGAVVPRSHLIVVPRMVARHALLDGLGAEVVEHSLGIGSQVKTDPSGQAGPGVWVAGNTADVAAGVMQSAASGVTAAAALNADLTAEDTAMAVLKYEAATIGHSTKGRTT